MAYAEKRANGWRVRYRLPDGTLGSEPGFPTKRAALEWGREQEVDVRRNEYIDPGDGSILLRDWGEMWLQAIDVAPNSLVGYRKRLRGRVNQRWGDLTLAAVSGKSLEIQAWRKQLVASHSENYARDLLIVLKMLMDAAVAAKRVKVQPVVLPSRRRGRYVRKAKAKKVFGSPGQVLALAENARTVWGLTGYVFILAKAYTGMRFSELCGLRREYCHPLWPASDPDPGQRAESIERYADMPAIRVQWQHEYAKVDESKPAVLVLAMPKYGSRRTLVIPPFLAQLLVQLLDSHDCEWVFPAMGGGPLATTDFAAYIWDPILKGAPERMGRYARPEVVPVPGLEGLVPHGLRHGHKVWLDEDDKHSRAAVEERMGHVLQGVEGVYSHVTPAMEKRIAHWLQKRWVDARRAARPGLRVVS
jgi:integrase